VREIDDLVAAAAEDRRNRPLRDRAAAGFPAKAVADHIKLRANASTKAALVR
jgi:hypothetical protein